MTVPCIAAHIGSMSTTVTRGRPTRNPTISTTHPHLADRWDAALNGGSPDEVALTNNSKFWWTCAEHESFRQGGRSLKVSGLKCPSCFPPPPSLKSVYPDIAARWDAESNGDLTPDTVASGSGKRVWWRCPHHGLYQRTVEGEVKARVKTERCCPIHPVIRSSTLAVRYPEVAAEWNRELNGDLTPETVAGTSSAKAWFNCLEGHDPYNAKISNRTTVGSGCPVCGHRRTGSANAAPRPGESVLDKYPLAAAAWDTEKNGIGPHQCSFASSKRRWFTCPSCRASVLVHLQNLRAGREYICTPCGRRQRSRPAEGHSLAELYPAVLKDWDYERNAGVGPADVRPGSRVKRFWRCSACGSRTCRPPRDTRSFRVEAQPAASPQYGKKCPRCHVLAGVDYVEGMGVERSQTVSLAAVHPGIAAGWAPGLNTTTPAEVLPSSGASVWWLCAKHGTYRRRVGTHVTTGGLCPRC